jgi:choline kinase
MQGLILAAGRGRRLGALAERRPKCLLDVGGQSILSHQLELLAQAGIDSPCVVVGHCADVVERELGRRGCTVFNASYRDTNNLYSFLLARHHLQGPVLVVNGDLLFCEGILRRLLAAGPDHLVVDSTAAFRWESTKVELRGQAVARADKHLEPNESQAESIGLLALSRATLEQTIACAERMVAAARQAFLPSIFGTGRGQVALRALDIGGLPWIEIDTPDDLKRARNEIWPRLRGGTSSWPSIRRSNCRA